MRDAGSGFGIRDSGFGIRDSGVGIRDSGVGSRDSGVGSRESGVGSRESGVGSRESARLRRRWNGCNRAFLLLRFHSDIDGAERLAGALSSGRSASVPTRTSVWSRMIDRSRSCSSRSCHCPLQRL
ncbi:hypothetical protein DGN21_06225 [Xanthomonas sp. MLO165]|nr:hypothetical protein DGN21_06225 [Xanthomonas sp. MLO165]